LDSFEFERNEDNEHEVDDADLDDADDDDDDEEGSLVSQLAGTLLSGKGEHADNKHFYRGDCYAYSKERFVVFIILRTVLILFLQDGVVQMQGNPRRSKLLKSLQANLQRMPIRVDRRARRRRARRPQTAGFSQQEDESQWHPQLWRPGSKTVSNYLTR
jgi:hypothetical protein